MRNAQIVCLSHMLGFHKYSHNYIIWVTRYSVNGNYQSIILEICCLLGTFLQKLLVGRLPLHVYHY